jgi:hypothetical protein
VTMTNQVDLQNLADRQREILTAMTNFTTHQYIFDSKLFDANRQLDELKNYISTVYEAINARFDRLEDQVDRLSADINAANYRLI